MKPLLAIVALCVVVMVTSGCEYAPLLFEAGGGSIQSQRSAALDSDAKAGARSAQTAIETYGADNDGLYAGATAEDMLFIEPTLTNYDFALDYADKKTYKLTVASESGNTFSIKRDRDGRSSFICTDTVPNAGCPESGDWSGADRAPRTGSEITTP